MRPLFLIAAFSCFASTALFAAKENSGTALGAIKLLPRGEYKKIVRIEAREGTPKPERWHIIVHDPKDESGVHEYVIAGGEIVASRAISQFVESVKPDDILKESLIKVDSDRVAALAQEYALANNVTIAALNYALKKEGAEAAPLWSVGCLDETGKQIGVLVVSAGKGNVISHEGFTAEPGTEAPARTETQGESEADREERRRYPRRTFVRVVAPRNPSTPVPEKKDVVSRVGNSLNRFFTGKKP
jgi:hypothetical protein